MVHDYLGARPSLTPLEVRMLTLLRNIPLIITWLPHVLTTVTMVEGLFGSAKSGPEKKAEVLAFLRNVARERNIVWADGAIDVLSQLIDTVVGVMNWYHQFRHRKDVPVEELKVQEANVAATRLAASVHVQEEAVNDEAFQRFLDSTVR